MNTAHKCAIESKALTHKAEYTVICDCRSNLSSLSSATFWSNGGSADVNDMSSKLLHGLSQMDADTLTSLSSGQCPDSGACMPCLEQWSCICLSTLASALDGTGMTCDTAYCMKDTHSAQTSGSFAAQRSSRCGLSIFAFSGGCGSFSHRW